MRAPAREPGEVIASDGARAGSSSWGAALLGGGTLVAAGLLLEVALRLGFINPFIIPPPSSVIASLWRVVSEENIPQRFLMTTGEALIAGVMITVVGVGAGLLLRRWTVLRRATETWVAATWPPRRSYSPIRCSW